MVFNHIVHLENKKQGSSIDKMIGCCAELGLDKSQIDDAIKMLLDGNVIQSYNTTTIFAIKCIR